MSTEGEEQPLLLPRKSSNSVRFHPNAEDDDNAGGDFPTPSERQQFLRSSSSLSYVFQKFSRSEREEALKCEGVGGAAFLIRDAVLGDDNTLTGFYDPYANPGQDWRNLISVVCRRLVSFEPLRRVELGLKWILILLTFIEPPIWCQHSTSNSGEDACEILLAQQGIAAGQNDTSSSMDDEDETVLLVQYYPNSKSMLLTTSQSHAVEWVCLAVIGIFLLFRFGRDGMMLRYYFRPGTTGIVHSIQVFCYVLLVVGQLTDYRMYQAYFRGVFLATSLPTVVRDVKVLVQMLPEVFNVLALLAVFITFYAWFGCVMFVGTPEGTYFPNLVEAWWTLWIMVTTANYPDVMMLAYNSNRWTAVYFVSFMILSFFFLMNVILSSVVGEYDTAVENRQKERVELSERNLKEAFRLMDPHGTGRIDRDIVMALFFILNEDFPEIRRLSDEDTKLLFAILDKDGSSTITEEEFMDFGNVILLEFVRSDVYATVVETCFPDIFASRWYQRLDKAVKSDEFEMAIDIILMINMAVIAIQSYPELSNSSVDLDPKYWDGSIDTVWELVETVFTGIYAVEALVKIIVLSWRRYVESQRNVFDFTITILAVVSSIIVYYPNEFSDSRIIRMIVMARVLRLVRLLAASKRFQLIGTISAEILPDAVPIIAMLFLIMYFFAALGVHLYGGLITRDPSNRLSWLVLGTDFAENDYWANNFNDMVSAMNVLFNLLVINNWTECEIGYEATTEAKWVRFYFMSFHVCGVILANNLVTAFIINSFLTQFAVMREKNDAEVVGDGEAVLNRQQALFDASVVTGTKTDLKGLYIARIRHTPESEEGRYHERLKRLFSTNSSRTEEK